MLLDHGGVLAGVSVHCQDQRDQAALDERCLGMAQPNCAAVGVILNVDD